MGSTCYAINTPCCCYVCVKPLWIEANVQTSNCLNECIKNLKNGNCHFQIPVLWFIKNEREKMSPVKEKEWEVCKLWGSVAFWVKGIHGYVYIEEATQNKSSLCHGESVVYIISEAEADSHLSSKAKDSCCMALEEECPAFELCPEWRSALSAGAAPPNTDGCRLCQASSHLMAALWDAVWKHHMGCSLSHIIPWKTVL